MNRKLLMIVVMILAGCTAESGVPTPVPWAEPAGETAGGAASAVLPFSPNEGPNPRVTLEDQYHVNFLLEFDQIRPVYRPRFAEATAVSLADDALVMGVAWGGEAKAYAVSVLRAREMVNDELAGIPILVTW